MSLLFPALPAIIAFTLVISGLGVLSWIAGLGAWIVFWVVIPVTTIERSGMLTSLEQGLDLTRGFRWSVAGLAVLPGIIHAAATWYALSQYSPLSEDEHPLAGFFIVYWILAAFFSALGAVIATVTYCGLRIQKEGADIEEIADALDRRLGVHQTVER